ncbi:MAG: 1-acyl-sn-glycerol-3-phosphate acyltransferase [Spirochaetaceae bacterium]|nr:MAG: 1-acyl-sn-glycerol-3-phosphate acyltransferase [Spirochaetaceae bacterium]
MSASASRTHSLMADTASVPGVPSIGIQRAPIAVPHPRRWVIVFARIILRAFLPYAYNLRVRGDLGILRRRGPFILVGNHQNFWDPFLAGLYMRAVPQFVTSDNIFRGGFFSYVMKGVGSIPISKYMRNTDTIRMISGVLKRGGVVGLYPESDRTYDGRSLPVRPEVVKLIRMMRVPVVGVHQRGGFLSGPKWGPHRRRGRIDLTYSLLYDPEKEGAIAQDELLSRVQALVQHDEMRLQRSDPVAFRSDRPAEGLERFLYECPCCADLQTHRTTADRMICMSCGLETTMDEYGLLHPSSDLGDGASDPGSGDWDLLETWSRKQSANLKRRLLTSRPGHAIFIQQVEVFTGFRTRRLVSIGVGSAVCHSGGITVTIDACHLDFEFGKIEGATVQNSEQFEFYYDGTLFRFGHTSTSQSGYIWYDAVRQACGEA